MARPRTPRPAEPNDPLGFGPLRDQFLEWLKVRNFSPRTIASRCFYLNVFIDWATQRGLSRPSEVTRPILERYQRWLFLYRQKNGQPLTFRSQCNRLLPLRAWFKWMTRQNFLLYNPAGEMELPKLEQRLPKYVLTAEEADLVMKQPNLTTPIGLRDRAILETLYSTGVRRMEVIGLMLYDLDPDRGTLVVRQGKGRKDRTVPIGKRALYWIDRYVHAGRPKLLASRDEGVLFLDEQGQPLEASALSYKVHRYVKGANINKSGSCHLFRHTAATLMLEGGADIRFIQVLLGHKKLTTTEIYTQVSIRMLKAVHEASHPAKWEEETPPPVDPA